MTNSREYTNGRGNTGTRRRRKQWLLSAGAGWGGDGTTVVCSEPDCDTVLTIKTLFVDRIISAEDGGRYEKGNVKPQCGPCSHRQGQRRTVAILKAKRLAS